jgi:hypothetical protein
VTTGLLILTLGAVAAGIFTLAVKIGQLAPTLRTLAAYVERLEQENTKLAAPDRTQETIKSCVKHTPRGNEDGMRSFISDIFGKIEGDKYFSEHPDDAARFEWFDLSKKAESETTDDRRR